MYFDMLSFVFTQSVWTKIASLKSSRGQPWVISVVPKSLVFEHLKVIKVRVLKSVSWSIIKRFNKRSSSVILLFLYIYDHCFKLFITVMTHMACLIFIKLTEIIFGVSIAWPHFWEVLSKVAKICMSICIYLCKINQQWTLAYQLPNGLSLWRIVLHQPLKTLNTGVGMLGDDQHTCSGNNFNDLRINH